MEQYTNSPLLSSPYYSFNSNTIKRKAYNCEHYMLQLKQ